MTASEASSRLVMSARDAWDTFEKLHELAKFPHALFFLHLALEKILKARVLAKTNQPPPPIHDLFRLAQAAGIPIDQTLRRQLNEISTFNVASRYDDEKLKFYKKATPEYAGMWHAIGKTLFEQFAQNI